MKKRSERRKHCALAVVRRRQKFRPTADPLPGDAGPPKFNQIYLQTQFGEDLYTQFRVIVVTDPQTQSHTHTHTHTHKPTNPQTGPITIHCAAKLSAQCKKSAQRRRKHCALAVVRRSQKFRSAADPLPGGAEQPKFNQLEMVNTFAYKPSLVKVDACNFELSW